MRAIWRALVREFFPVSILLAGAAVAGVYATLGPVSAIKGGYVLIGLFVAAGVYALTVTPHEDAVAWARQWSLSGKLVLVAIALAVLVADATGSRSFVVLGVLPVCFLLLALQLWRGASPSWVLVQTVALFLVTPVTQYLTTGFYFARGDTTQHVRWIEAVVRAGTWRAIPGESFYSSFPGLHTLVASVSALADLSAYDAFMIVGIATYAVVVVTVYCLGRLLFDRSGGLYVAVATTILTPVIVHAAYFFPQSLFVGLLLVVLFVAFRTGRDADMDHAQFTVLTAALVAVLILTHHLSVILFLPLVAALLVAIPVVDWVTPQDGPDPAAPRAVPFAVLGLGGFAYWSLQETFFDTFVAVTRETLRNTLFASDTAAPRQYVVLGGEVPELTVGSSLLSLASSSGVYNALLLAVVALGAVTVLRAPGRYRRAGGALVVGAAGSLFVLRTPLAPAGLNRVRLPVSVFVAVLAGAGLRRLFAVPDRSIRRGLPAVVVFVLLATSAHATAGLDLYEVHSGPDLWERHPMPEAQTEFTDREDRSLDGVARFTDRYDAQITTDWVSDLGVRRHGGPATGTMRLEGDGIAVDRGFLLYRHRWTERSQTVFPPFGSDGETYTFAVTDAWFDRLVTTEHKVYASGEAGLLLDRDRSDALTTNVSE